MSDTPRTKAFMAELSSRCDDWSWFAQKVEDFASQLERELAKLQEALDWQNVPNRREPLRGGYEFYINEEWTCIRDAAMDEDPGFQASLMKVRFDPDDERVRIRRILDDDAIFDELEAEKAENANLKQQVEELKVLQRYHHSERLGSGTLAMKTTAITRFALETPLPTLKDRTAMDFTWLARVRRCELMGILLSPAPELLRLDGRRRLRRLTHSRTAQCAEVLA